MDYVKKYASEEALRQSEQDAVSSSSESSMSDFSEDEAQVSYLIYTILQKNNPLFLYGLNAITPSWKNIIF